MKLYTEEQVRKSIDLARALSDWWNIEYQFENNDIIDSLTPIELPSDEEINLEGIGCYNGRLPYNDGFIDGAKWVIEQIKKQGK